MKVVQPVRKGMILAAGEGTRLRPLTLSRPKPIMPIAGKPLLSYTLRMAKRLGLQEVVINLFWRPDDITAGLGDGSQHGLAIHYSPEEEILGTAGGVKRVASVFEDDFLVLYGDNFYDITIDNLLDLHRASKADATIGLCRTEDPSRCGIAETDAQQRVTRFVEKPPKGTETTDAANAGVYILSPGLLEAIPEGVFSDFGTDIFPKLLDSGARIYADFVEGYLQDTGTFDLYRSVNFHVAGTGTEAICGADCELDTDSADLCGSVLWDRCVIEADTVVDRCILADGCRVRRGARVFESVLGDSVEIGESAHVVGSVIWPGLTVPDACFLENRTVKEMPDP